MPNWKKVVVSGSDATLNSLYTAGDITSSGDIFVSSSKSYYLGANSYLRRELNSGGYESIQLNGSVRLNPNTAASANNGVVIGGNGYLLSANSSRNAQLNYGSVSGQMGIYRLNVYGSDAIFRYNVDVTGSLEVLGGITGSLLGTASFATQALSASYSPGTNQTLEQVTNNGNTTGNAIIITGSLTDSLTLKTNGIAISGSVSGPYYGKTHEVIYDTTSVLPSATTTISQLPVPYVAGFTFDYVAFVSTSGGGASAAGLNVGRAGTVKGILRGSSTFSKGFQIAETTTLDLEDQGKGTDGLQFTVIQDATGNSNQLVAITNNDWAYTINYTLTLYNNPVYS